MSRGLHALLVGACLALGPATAIAQEVASPFEQDIALLVREARKLEKLWPWQPPLPEVRKVAAHGKPIAPRLAALLRLDEDTDILDVDWHVEQQVELALCEIFGIQTASGKTVFGNRSSDVENKTIKRFWEARVQEYLRTGR